MTPEVPGHITGIANAYGVVDAYNEIVDNGLASGPWTNRVPNAFCFGSVRFRLTDDDRCFCLR